MKHTLSKSSSHLGFTLIELLIVIAILGVLAVVVLVVINPTERLAQSRDAGRMGGVTQLGHALQGYYTDRAAYPAAANWAQDLVSTSIITSFPAGIAYTAYSVSNCTGFVQPGTDPTFCYALDATNGALVYSRAEANGDNNKCTDPEVAYFVYATSDGHGGTICASSEPTPWVSGTQTYVD